ncbi:MAG: hypothetical protein AAGA18_08535 [Verrucomicrobiota bacterium]
MNHGQGIREGLSGNDYSEGQEELMDQNELFDREKAIGDIVEVSEDGQCVSITLNSDMSAEEIFEKHKELTLKEQKEREAKAKHPDFK